MATASKHGQLELYMYDAPPGARLYMGLSGGLDSAYLSYRLLSMGYRLLLHHCTYKTKQNRWPHEERAYQDVLEWLVDHKLTNWELIETEFSPGSSVPYWFLDYEYLWWIAGVHLRRHPKNQARQDIRHIVIPSHQESANLGSVTLQKAYTILNTAARRHIRPIHPMQKYDRPRILADMPPDLIERCWWCRTPKNEKPCHTCSTCKVVDPALKQIGYI